MYINFIVLLLQKDEFQYISDDYRAYLLENYDDAYYPEQISGSGRAAYVERNYIMIDHSNTCVVYYNEDYQPPKRKNSRRDISPLSTEKRNKNSV